MRLKFDSVAKLPECPDHSDRAHSLGLFAHRRAALLIANAFIQNHPDQVTETMRNRADGFVVAETRNETTVDDLEDASFTFDGSIGGLIEKATHVPVPLRRARAVVHSRGSFIYPVAIQNTASRRIAENLHGEIIGNRTNPKYDSVAYRIPFYESPYSQFS